MSMQQASQHKRSLSFNHHLSYNQYSNPNMSTVVGTLNQKQMYDMTQPIQLREKIDQQTHSPKTNAKGNHFAPDSRVDSKILITFSCLSFAANWSIVNLRPAPPLRPTLITNSSGGGSSAVLTNTRKTQPTYEEDALVLRVIEAYCVAYQNPSRNAVHSG